MNNVLFSGCSFVEGCGLELGKEDPNNFCNVFSTEVFGTDYKLKNIGVRGYSNLRIFLDTCKELIDNQYDYVFVGWSSYPRYVFWAGLEEYECKRNFIPGSPIEEHKGNDISFDSKYMESLRDRFLLVHHAHYDILDIVKYIKILMCLAEQKNTKIYFINNICHWDQDYFKVIEDKIIPSNLTKYTNNILNTDNRDDEQIEKLYKKMHQDYASAGGINESLWLNLYESFSSKKIDTGTDKNDKLHPGPQSHINFGKFLAKQFRHQV